LLDSLASLALGDQLDEGVSGDTISPSANNVSCFSGAVDVLDSVELVVGSGE